MLGLFRNRSKFSQVLCGFLKFGANENYKAFAEQKCITHFDCNCRRVFIGKSVFPYSDVELKGATILSFSPRPNGAVQPPLHRTPRAVVLSECFGSSNCYERILSVQSGKIWLRSIFETLVAFSNY